LEISYRQGENGWGRTTIVVGGTTVEADVSYLSEPLVELANLARRVLNPDWRYEESSVSFLDEPGAFVLHVMQADRENPNGDRPKVYNSGVIVYNEPPDQMKLKVLLEQLEDGMSAEPEIGELLAEETLTSLDFARAIFRCLDEVNAIDTAWSFLQKNIDSPFPLTEFAILGAMLGEEPRVRRLW
jgi:hypothetical protein